MPGSGARTSQDLEYALSEWAYRVRSPKHGLVLLAKGILLTNYTRPQITSCQAPNAPIISTGSLSSISDWSRPVVFSLAAYSSPVRISFLIEERMFYPQELKQGSIWFDFGGIGIKKLPRYPQPTSWALALGGLLHTIWISQVNILGIPGGRFYVALFDEVPLGTYTCMYYMKSRSDGIANLTQ